MSKYIKPTIQFMACPTPHTLEQHHEVRHQVVGGALMSRVVDHIEEETIMPDGEMEEEDGEVFDFSKRMRRR